MNKREEDIIRYVSNEMNRTEREQFEVRLANDDNLREEVNALKDTQQMLQQWPDAEFDIPSFASLKQEHKPSIRQLRALPNRQWISYAAAILLLLSVAWLTDLQVSQKDNALVLSFGPVEPESSYPADQVAQIVEAAVAKYAAQTNSQKTTKEEVLDQRFSEMEQKMTSRLASLYQKEIAQINLQLSDHERKQLMATEDLVRGLQLEQRLVLQEAIIAVLDQLEQQRLEDRIDVENAFQQITAILAELQDGGISVASGLVDGEVRHY